METYAISNRTQDKAGSLIKAMLYIEIKPCGNISARIQEHSDLHISKHWGREVKCLVQNTLDISLIVKFLFVFLA